MQNQRQRLKLRPLAQHGQPGEQQVFQRSEPPHLLAQHRSDAVEDQFPFLQEPVEIPIEEFQDRLRHDLEGQGIACVAGHQSLPGGRRAAESFVAEQVLCGLFVHPGEAQRAHQRAHPLQRLNFLGFLTAGEQHAALVCRLGQALNQPPVALVAGQVVALAVTALEQRLQVVEYQQAAMGLQEGQELRDALLQRRGEGGGRRLGEEGDAVGDQLLAGRRVTDRAPEQCLEVGSQVLTEVGGQHTLADAAHAQERYQAAALLHDPLGELGHFHLATGEVAHVQGSHPVDAREGCGLRSCVGSLRLGLWERLDGHRRTDQPMEPCLIQQHLLVCRVPESADLLFLAPGGKGFLLGGKRQQRFEVVGLGIGTASLPLGHRSPGDTKLPGQASLGQADGGAQRLHQLTEGIISLTIQGALHERSSFRVTHRSKIQ